MSLRTKSLRFPTEYNNFAQGPRLSPLVPRRYGRKKKAAWISRIPRHPGKEDCRHQTYDPRKGGFDVRKKNLGGKGVEALRRRDSSRMPAGGGRARCRGTVGMASDTMRGHVPSRRVQWRKR